MKKIKLFTHTDLDGVGCGIVMKYVREGKNEIEISHCNYDIIDKEILEFLDTADLKEYVAVYVTDISVNEETAKKISDFLYDIREAEYISFQLFDHHKTANWLNKYYWANVYELLDEQKTSGTELLFQHFMDLGLVEKSKIPILFDFVKIVTNYDTWRWDNMEEQGFISKNVNDLLYIFGRDEFYHRMLSKFEDSEEFGVFCLSQTEKLILEIKEKEKENYFSYKKQSLKIIQILQHKVGVVYADSYPSELGNLLCKENPEIDYIAIINMSNCTVSLRTVKEDLDLGSIAKQFGGGGHPKAAGFKFEEGLLSFAKSMFYMNYSNHQ